MHEEIENSKFKRQNSKSKFNHVKRTILDLDELDTSVVLYLASHNHLPLPLLASPLSLFASFCRHLTAYSVESRSTTAY